MEQLSVRTVLVEGGATAAALVEHLHWKRFRVAASAPAGVGVLKPEAPAKESADSPSLALQASTAEPPTLLIKPGSYDWPDEIWRQFAGNVD